MLAGIPPEYYWTLPLIFVTGWVLGWVHFRDSFHRKHPDLFEQWKNRTDSKKEEGS